LKLSSIPVGIPAGDYQLVFQLIDSTGATNAVAIGGIHIVPPQIDLTGTFTKVLRAGKSNKQTVIITLVNRGTTTAHGQVPIVIDASATPGLSGPAEQLLARSATVNLRPGRTQKLKYTLDSPGGFGSNFYLIAQIDPSNAIGDVNTSNNLFASRPITMA
jgi:hypothetical protein